MPSQSMKTIYIIRHGQSLANTGAMSMPEKVIPLTKLGITQAQNLLTRWQAQSLPIPKHIYHSQMLRAKQTAQVFADEYDVRPTEDSLLNEFSCLGYKTVEGMIGKQRSPLAQQYWQTAEIDYRDNDDADTFEEFVARVDNFIRHVPTFDDNSLFFGHGIWIGLLAYRLLGCHINNNADMQKFRQFQQALPMYNTVAYRLDISEDWVMQLRVVEALKG